MLELQGLSRRYGDVVALDDLSFTVREGQMFGFVGPNGAGKTTAMRIVLGVLEPDRGEVRWRGRPVDAAIRRRFGYMPEDHGQTFSTQCARDAESPSKTADPTMGEEVASVSGGPSPARPFVHDHALGAGVGLQGFPEAVGRRGHLVAPAPCPVLNRSSVVRLPP